MDNKKTIPTRDQLPLESTWSLEDLYPNDDVWEQDFEKLPAFCDWAKSFEGKLAESGAVLYDYLYRNEEFNLLVDRLANYAMRKQDEDTANAKYQAMVGKLMASLASIGAATGFETPEMMAIDEDTLAQFYANEPKLERYRRFLTDLRRQKDHVLSPAEEKLLAAASEMARTPSAVFGAFSNADLKFPDVSDGQGNMHPLSAGTFVSYQESEDRVLRKNAFEALYHTLEGFKNTAAGLLNGQGKKLKFFADARKYDSTLEAALSSNDVPAAVYHNLIESVHRNLDKMHRYVHLRKKLLGVDDLHFYDVYAPLVSGVDKKIPFAQAKQTVYDALAPLGEDYRAILKHGFENRWIDVYENVGKRSGAYSAGAHVHPYVLLNYTGTLDSQFTLAHEMGHALHSYLSNKTQNPIDSDYVIFVAEVASTCNEALLMEYLLGKTTDKKERAYLINHFLEQFKSTLYRQTMFAEFELNIGKMIAEGQTLTADALSQEYQRLNEQYFGDAMVIDPEIAMEWARIPHFYYNYYVFQYATGYAAAIALSRKILAGGESSVKDYLEFLSGGCSKSPIDLLKGAGVDMTDTKPIDDALSLFGELLDEMEALMADE